MERSIENIWKEGFLKSDALIAPRINNLYTQKSIHIIDKFTRMFKINLIAIVAFSFAFLGVSFLFGIPLMGILFFVTLMAIVLINHRLLKGLEKIDKGESSYQYLKAFNQWISEQVSVNSRLSYFYYPIFFLSIITGLWFKDAQGMFLGERLVQSLQVRFPEMYLVNGIPLIGMIIMMVVVVLLAIFGGRIYRWDLNLVYGRVFKKLAELLADIEELKK